MTLCALLQCTIAGPADTSQQRPWGGVALHGLLAHLVRSEPRIREVWLSVQLCGGPAIKYELDDRLVRIEVSREPRRGAESVIHGTHRDRTARNPMSEAVRRALARVTQQPFSSTLDLSSFL